MSFWKGLFVKEDRFLMLLEASAEEGRASVKELALLLNSPPGNASLESLLESRTSSRAITREIDELLCQSNSAPMEVADIEELARALGRIPKGIKKFAERYQLCAKRVSDVRFDEQLKMLETCVNTICQMVSSLKTGSKVAAAKVSHDTLQKVEKEADKLLVAAVVELYQRRHEPMKTLMLKDLYELLERVIDRCWTAGSVLLRINLKNS